MLKNSTSDYYKINSDLLKATLLYNDNETESLLIGYYKAWENLAKKNRANYIQGKSDSLKYSNEPLNVTIANEIYDLMLPYKICNYNCYVIMLTLKKMGSNFFINKNLEYHKKFGESEDLSDEISKREKLIFILDKTLKTISLNKSYNTIKDIDFDNESMFKNSYLKNIKSNYEIYGFYNLKSGIIGICYNNFCNYYLVQLVGEKKLDISETTLKTITSE